MRDLAFHDGQVERDSPGAAVGVGGDAVGRLDAAVAIGVDIQVSLAGREIVEHDRDAYGIRTPVAELGVAATVAAVGRLLDHVLGLLPAQCEGTQRWIFERFAWRRRDEPPGAFR